MSVDKRMDAEWLHLILCAKCLGLSKDDIREFLQSKS